MNHKQSKKKSWKTCYEEVAPRFLNRYMRNFNKLLCIVSNKKGDIFCKYLGIKINSFTKAKENLFTTTPKILAVVCNAFDERFGASLWRHGSNKCYLCKL